VYIHTYIHTNLYSAKIVERMVKRYWAYSTSATCKISRPRKKLQFSYIKRQIRPVKALSLINYRTVTVNTA